MKKSRAVEWLEQQTGESLEQGLAPSEDMRNLSMRIPVSLFERLEALAVQHGETVSQVARRMLDRGVDSHVHPDRDAIDHAIATLQHLRSTLPTTAA